jgi:hypothetical protein
MTRLIKPGWHRIVFPGRQRMHLSCGLTNNLATACKTHPTLAQRNHTQYDEYGVQFRQCGSAIFLSRVPRRNTYCASNGLVRVLIVTIECFVLRNKYEVEIAGQWFASSSTHSPAAALSLGVALTCR